MSVYPNPGAADHLRVTLPVHCMCNVRPRLIRGDGGVRSAGTSVTTRYRLYLGDLSAGSYTLRAVHRAET